MSVVTFDTHAVIKMLQESGFEEIQAEALTEVFKTTQETYLSDLATKQDIKDVRQEIGQVIQEITQIRKELLQEMKALEFRLDNKIEAIKGDITLLKWMIGVVIAGIMSLVMKAFF
ncbi:MAG TPA: hypothetical protein VJL89_10040 [Thermodesulfovibrionia bacterium]|nr:hypothetical protein [Thermodesulfovibrionia bacterium]